MRNAKIYLYSLLITTIFSCGNEVIQTNNALSSTESQVKLLGCYKATIGKKDILFELFAVQDSVFGRYCYTKYKSDLSLNGYYNSADGNYIIYESHNGNRTGIWELDEELTTGQWKSLNSRVILDIKITEQISEGDINNLYDGYLTKIVADEQLQVQKYKQIWTKSKYQGYMKIDGRITVSSYGKLNILGPPVNNKIDIYLGYETQNCANGGIYTFKISDDYKTAYNPEYTIIVTENNLLKLKFKHTEYRCQLFEDYIKVE